MNFETDYTNTAGQTIDGSSNIAPYIMDNWDNVSSPSSHNFHQLDSWGLHGQHVLKHHHHHHHLSQKASIDSPMTLTLPITPAESPMLTAMSLSTAQSSNSSLHSAASMDHVQNGSGFNMFAPQPFLEYLGAPSADASTDALFNPHLYSNKTNAGSVSSIDELEHHHMPHVVLPSSDDSWGHQQITGSPKTIFDDRLYSEIPISPPIVASARYTEISTRRSSNSRRTIKSGSSARFTCSEDGCNKTFKRMEHLSRHLRMHSGERPFICSEPDCHRKFSRSDNLQAHKYVG